MKTAVLLGTFDGLHAGHRAVVEAAKGFFSVAVTFDIPPKSFFADEAQLLMLPCDRVERLKELGIDKVDIQRFGDVRNIEADVYLQQLKQKYNPQRIICGFNYRFGKDAAGDTNHLAEFCSKNGIEFVCVPPVCQDGRILSSTYIRGLVREGKISEASSQIYGGFGFTSPVIHGDARGRKLGFPTANQEYPNDLIKVKFGVYISRVTIAEKQYKAITNVGIRPTYETEIIGCESFIKDFDSDIYGTNIKLELLHFVREEKKFSSEDKLKNAILNDIKLLD